MSDKKRVLDLKSDWQCLHLTFKCTENFHPSDLYPMANRHKQRLLEMLFQFLRLFKPLRVVGFSAMASHLHCLICIPKEINLSLKEVADLFEECYGRKMDARSHECHVLRSKLNDVSAFASRFTWYFSHWYNRQCKPLRRGNFWRPRFHSTLLCTPKAFFQCWLYIQMNPVKAKKLKCNHPIDYRFGTMGSDIEECKEQCLRNFYDFYCKMQGSFQTVTSYESFLKLIDQCINEEIEKVRDDLEDYQLEHFMFTYGRAVGDEEKIEEHLLRHKLKHKPNQHGDFFSFSR